MPNFWVSWYSKPDPEYDEPRVDDDFELHWPWWITGSMMDGTQTICAAIQAPTEWMAKAIVCCAHDIVQPLQWRFCTRKPDDWSPFGNDRFEGSDWMKWPPAQPVS